MSDTLSSLQQRATLFLGAGVLVAALTAYAAFRVLSTYQAELVEARQPQALVPVVVAVRDLSAGARVTADDVRIASVEAPGPDAASIYARPEDVVGQTVQSTILAGETVRRERFVSAPAGSALAAEVGMGMRAVTVEVSRAQGVGGRLRRGDLVDVIVTVRPDEGAGSASWVTETILQGIQILDAGEPDAAATKVEGAAPPAPRTIGLTLEVEPEEAEKLALATARGELHVALRGRADFGVVPHAAPLVTNTLVGLGKTSPERARVLRSRASAVTPAAAGSAAEVIQGSERQEERFDAEGRHVPPSTRKR